MIKCWSRFHIQILWYSFTLDNRFLVTLSLSVPEEQENTFSSASRHISNSLNVYLFRNSDLNYGEMKVQVKRAFKSFFFLPKKTQTGLACNFLHFPIQVWRGVYIPNFKISAPIFCCSNFFEECHNLQVKINKMVSEHTVDYHPIPSELISRIHLLIYLGTPKGLIYPSQMFLEFFSQPCIFSHGCRKVSNW